MSKTADNTKMGENTKRPDECRRNQIIQSKPADGQKFRQLLIVKRTRDLSLKKTPVRSRMPQVASKPISDRSKAPRLHRENNSDGNGANNPLLCANSITFERMIETNAGMVSVWRSVNRSSDDINRLIKKLTLSFTAQKGEADFVINNGVFDGSRFHIRSDLDEVSLSVDKASPEAQRLLRAETPTLKSRLLQHEIKLGAITFVS